MKTKFRLYNSLNSSYFDLIDGEKEMQQTKGLGLLLAKSKPALTAFLAIKPLKDKIGKVNIDKIDRIVINCELISSTTTKYRADIVVRLYVQGKPFKALLLEAKSINKSTSVYETNKQIENYLVNKVFKELEEFKSEVYGITLTKFPSYIQHQTLASITWSDIIKAFHKIQPNNGCLLDDYFNFLTNINGTMKFYEKEVFSIPTADWSRKAIDSFNVYECPNKGKYQIKQKPLYLAFRKSGGGEMDKLYKVEDIILINFKEDFSTFIQDENTNSYYRDRVKKYAEYMQANKKWKALPNDEKQVFILSENTIELANKPKPAKNNSFRAYYELADLLNKEIV